MHQRYEPHRGGPGERRSDTPRPRHSVHAVLALQRAIGNQGTGRLLARKKDKNRHRFEHSVKIGDLGPIEITASNVSDWPAKKDPGVLEVFSQSGEHSAELLGLFVSGARFDTVETVSVIDENRLVTTTFEECRIAGYSTDGEMEKWTVEFKSAKRQPLPIAGP